MASHSIEDVINYADEQDLCKKDDKFNRFITENSYLYNRVKKVPFQEFQNLYFYLEGHTPFSTQHKTKGAEFDNVLIILDNGGWNSSYNFNSLFCLNNANQNVLSKTQKIFYVCCTRAKENLIVYYENPSDAVIEKAKSWFGADNIHHC
jgi:DNA helicase-2/ATP-dependent DNA helicase PcrA